MIGTRRSRRRGPSAQTASPTGHPTGRRSSSEHGRRRERDRPLHAHWANRHERRRRGWLLAHLSQGAWMTCVAVALLCAAPANAAPIPIESPNWTGYVADSPDGAPMRFTAVHGQWTQPSVSCTPAHASVQIWVGLGGSTPGSGALEQIGTSVQCDKRGQAQHRAWFEFWPYPAHPVDGRVRPGDSISATVRVTGTTVRLRIQNLSRHWDVTRTVSSLIPDLSTAEWIVEAPQTCHKYTCRRTLLAPFGSVSFTDVFAATPTTSGGLANTGWTVSAVSLVPPEESAAQIREAAGDEGVVADPLASPPAATGGPGAKPRQPTADGHSFAVDWLPRT